MQKKPIIQLILWILSGVVGGLLLMGQILDGIANAVALITFELALWSTIIVVILYVILLFLFRKRLVKWRSKDGQLVNIRKVGSNIILQIIGILILFWVAAIYNVTKASSMPLTTNIIRPIFDSIDSRFKILVLPFDKECDYQGTKYDIGKVICKRLEMLNDLDTLNLITHYFNDSLNFENFNEKQADSLMKYHHANQIIYGYYSLRQCEAGDSDKICFNYLTDADRWNLGKKQFKTDYVMIDMAGIDALRNGVGQEDIEYVVHLVAGISAIKEKQFTKAIRRFQNIKNFESYQDIQYKIGICYFSLQNYAKAKVSFENALKIDSNYAGLWHNLGNALIKLGDYAKARGAYEKALEGNTGFSLAWSGLGTTYILLENIPKAKEAFERAVEIDRNDFNAWYNLGTFYSATHDGIVKAKFAFEAAVQIANVDTLSLFRAFLSLGNIYERLNTLAKAKEYFEKAFKIVPADTMSLFGLGTAFNTIGEHRKARECFTRVLKIQPNHYNAWYGLGIAFEALQEYQRASICYRKTILVNPKFDMAWNNLGGVNLVYRDSLKAIECYKKAVKINSNNYITWGNLANMYSIYLKDNKQAIYCFEKSFKINPTLQLSINLARLNNSEKNKASTIYYLRKSIVIDSTMKSLIKTDTAFEWLHRDKQFLAITR